MTNQQNNLKLSNLLKSIGPGLLFASTAIGTSHLVLSTRAGAHYGMIFLWVILATLILKYPFYEFGPRYANATGFSLLKGYKDQGRWAVILFMLVIFINMFAVVGAIGAVSAGLLKAMWGMEKIAMPILMGGLLSLTAILLLVGRFNALDNFVKLISVVLLITVLIAFVAVLIKGPIAPVADFQPQSILEGAGLGVLISLIGWMPNGIEGSTMHSIWSVEKMRTTGYRPTLKESLFDFKLGYFFTLALALMFLTIGAFSVYGSGQTLTGNSTQFSNKLLAIFTTNIGEWSYPILAIAAFGTIYGTLITAWDAFARSFVRGLQVFKFDEIAHNEEQTAFLQKNYNIFLPIIGLGGFALFYFSAASMIQILTMATSVAFITAPIIAFLNLKSIQSADIPASHRPPQSLIILAYIGLVAMLAFAAYYLFDLFGS